jgi:hypothetical protein
MDNAVTKNAIGGLDKILSRAKRALYEVGRNEFGGSFDGSGYDDPRGALGAHLEEIYDVLLVVLEAAQMPLARTSLTDQWAKWSNSLQETDDDAEYGVSMSPALTYVSRIVSALRMTVSGSMTSEEAWTLSRLEAMLGDTSALVHRRKIAPANESALQEIMHDYLSASFSDFTSKPQIGGTIKNFKPDCGIVSVGAAIEFKLAHDKPQAVQSFTGIVEDIGGYKGSKDWTRFYAVMFQSKPFVLKSHLECDLKRIGAATWKAILINGETNPSGRRKRMPKVTVKA